MDAAALIKALIEKQVKAEGNFFGSIAPSLWAQGLEINSILYEDYGVKMFSNVVACKRSTIEKKPELCEAFVGGLMEGLKYVYLNPEKSVALHLESVKEFQGGSVANQKVIEYGQAVSTALGVVPAVRQHGLGYMDPDLVATTAKTVETYMGVKNAPPIETAVHQQVRRRGEADRGGMGRGRKAVGEIPASQEFVSGHTACARPQPVLRTLGQSSGSGGVAPV